VKYNVMSTYQLRIHLTILTLSAKYNDIKFKLYYLLER